MGEFGFITGDGVYHLTVYATDENGNFKILKMKNTYIGLPMEKLTTPLPAIPAITTPKLNQITVTNKPTKLTGGAACSGCRIPTKTTPEKEINQVRPISGTSGQRYPNNAVEEINKNGIDIRIQPGLGEKNTPYNQLNKNQPPPAINFKSDQNPKQPTINGPTSQFKNEKQSGINLGPNNQLDNNRFSKPYNTLNNDNLNVLKTNSPNKQNNVGYKKMNVSDLMGLLYKFNYTLTYHGHNEVGNRAGEKNGSYFFNGRDGFGRDVKYIANEFGYQPNITLVELNINDTPKEETEKMLTKLLGAALVDNYHTSDNRIQIKLCCAWSAGAKIGGWDTAPNTQYHIQTDEGPERYFKYQTISGQYRKEKRLQDGTVVGSYGWVDANGFLRLRDYIADDKGYRIVNTKMVQVGAETPIGQAVSVSKDVPSQGGVGLQQNTPRPPTSPAPISLSDYLKEKYATSPAPISLSDYLKEKQYGTTPASVSLSTYLKTPIVEVSNNGLSENTAAPGYSQESSATPAPLQYQSTPAPYYTTTPSYVRPQTFRPYFNPNAISYDQKAYETVGAAKYETGQGEYPQYDGVAMTHNGFRYYLPRHYHEEETLPGEQRAGSFGYIDPFGIRRVIYYNTSPEGGFVHRKNNRYVGFQATPYDPRF